MVAAVHGGVCILRKNARRRRLRTVERVCQSLLKRYNQVVAGPGGKDFEVEPTNTRKQLCAGNLPKSVLVVGRDAFKKVLD